MLKYATYAVISPEGCASILWRTADRAADAAEAMGITAERLHKLGLADCVVTEPLGGAHRNINEMADTLKAQLKDTLSKVQALSTEDMLERRYQRYMSYGIPV